LRFLTFLTIRLLKAAMVILAVLIINFILIHLAPGDPASIMAGEAGASDPHYVTQLRQQFGLDQPLYQQFTHYLGNILRLDLGYSYRKQLPVLPLILERLPATLLLMSSAFFLSLGLGIGLGALAAKCHYTRQKLWLDKLIMSLALLFYATPLFWLALLGIILFSVVLGWLPTSGMHSVDRPLQGFAYGWDVVQHLILPTLSLLCFSTAVYARFTRTAMLSTIQENFVKTARAQGVPTARIIRRHVLKNALLPVVTFSGFELGQLAGGAVLIETIFAWPGIGRLMFDALMQRDYLLLLGVFFTTSTLVVFFNVITDLIYRWIDPRIEEGL
jgi:peptide/nickel transport system permease protein